MRSGRMQIRKSPIEQYQHDVIGANTKFEKVVDRIKYDHTTRDVGNYIKYLENKHQQLIDEHVASKEIVKCKK
jgi:hypothetical protein